MRVHRIIVAHGASEACRRAVGGSGSLMIVPGLLGDDYLLSDNHAGSREGPLLVMPRPFMLGQIDPRKGFVHVLDDITLDVLMGTLDTVRDFGEYLSRKERLVAAGKLGYAASEEDLLGYYLRRVGPDGWYDFMVPTGTDGIIIDEGLWLGYQEHPQRLAQQQANHYSYAWDGLIERFNRNILHDTRYELHTGQYDTTGRGAASSEQGVRFLAREPRVRRRFLTAQFIDLYRTFGAQSWKAVRVIKPSSPGDPYYVFMVMRHPEGVPYAQYREARGHCLRDYAYVVKATYPDANDIVGIGTGPPDNHDSAEDVLYLDTQLWTEADLREAERVQQETDYLTTVIPHEGTIRDYPDLAPSPNP
jgi:hypothetical protein